MAVKFLGQFLLEKGLINKDQLLAALDAQRASNPLLGELAQACGWLTAAQSAQVNAMQRSQDRPFGEIARTLGLLTDAQVDALLAQQKAGRKLFGEILVQLGILDAEQVGRALEMQASERESAVQGLDLGVAGHPLQPVLRTAIETCNRLFMRTLKRRSQFSSLVENAAEVAWCSVVGPRARGVIDAAGHRPGLRRCDHRGHRKRIPVDAGHPVRRRARTGRAGGTDQRADGLCRQGDAARRCALPAPPHPTSRRRSPNCCDTMHSPSRWRPNSDRSCWWSVAATRSPDCGAAPEYTLVTRVGLKTAARDGPAVAPR